MREARMNYGGFLWAAKQMIDALPDQNELIRRRVRYAQQEAQRVAEETLISGAMPGDFQVVHFYRTHMPLGTRLE